MNPPKSHGTHFRSRDADLYWALALGLESLLRKHCPEIYKRLSQAFPQLEKQYHERLHRQGKKSARQYLIARLSNLPLADRRKGKSLTNDRLLCTRYDQLRKRLKEIFKKHSGNLSMRNSQAAPIVSQVLGSTHAAKELSPEKRLAEFCYATLGTNSVGLSRARKRLRDDSATRLEATVNSLEQIVSSGTNPDFSSEQLDNARRALKILSDLRSFHK